MKRRILILFALACVGVFAAVLYAQQQKAVQQLSPDRVDLETETLVGKRLERTETGPNGKKIYHYLYRVEARQTAKSLPRYIVDHRYNITYTTDGFKPGDTITLLSTNEESETDSPIWVYNVTYVGSGSRKITFDTSGSVFAPSFVTVSGETDCGGVPGCPTDCNGCGCTCHEECLCEKGGEHEECECGCADLDCECDCHKHCKCKAGECVPWEDECDCDDCESEESDCTCTCHCICFRGQCQPIDNVCTCKLCPDNCPSILDCCHHCGHSMKCPGENCPDKDTTCLCSCHGLCCYNTCSENNCPGKTDPKKCPKNCKCHCEDCPPSP